MNFDPSWLSLDTMPSVELYSESVLQELTQCLDEGRDVEKYADLARAIQSMEKTPIREELASVFWRAMMEAPIRAGFPFEEPNSLEEIRAARPKDIAVWQQPEKDDALFRRLRGAWLGRVCGCLLGKPVEGWKTPDLQKLLSASGNLPLTRYMSMADVDKASLQHLTSPKWAWIDIIGEYAPVDDDTNYTALAAHIVGKYGRAFTPHDVAEAWIAMQSKHSYCTAERRAYRNFLIGIRPPKSAEYKNPDREFIGAQIRGDYFGYINPGNPELAAEMAWRDASISHVKNGIYGEMFVAAMLAVAAVCSDIRTVILEGLKQIPEKSRLADRIRAVIGWYEEGVSKEECFRRIHEEWDEFSFYHWVHTLPNAMIVAASLLYGGKDYSRSICMAVETGFDTDCNGATVGSILGMMLTDAGIPACWTDPIHGKLRTNIIGLELLSLDEAAELTMKHCEG